MLNKFIKNRKTNVSKIACILFSILLFIGLIIYVLAVVPTHGTPLLNSTFGTNGTSENLTAFNITTADTEGDPVKSIYQWYLNNTPIAVAVLPFEGGSNNSQTNDTSPFGNSGVVNGGTWANNSGYDGFGAYNFSGVNPNNITLANSQSLNITGNEITLEAWVRINGTAGLTTGGVISRQAPGPVGTQYSLDVSAGELRMILRNNTNAITSTTTGTTILLNVWYHIVGTYNTTNTILYVDGTQRAISNFSGNIVPQNVSVRIGQDSGGSRLFNGTIDDVRIYNVSLTAEQVLAHYRNRTNTIAGSRDLNRTLLRAGDVWNASVHPFDSSGNGTTRFTTSLTLLANASPSHDRPILNSTTGINTTAENITVYNVSLVDPDGDSIKNIYNWYRNNTAIAVINMPFEGGSDNSRTNDTSLFGNNGTVTGPTWNVTGGYDSKGAYNFDGINDYISIAHSTSFKPLNEITITAWVRPHTNSLDEYREIYRKEDGAPRHLFSFQKSSGCSGLGGTGGCLSFGISTGGVYAEQDVNIVRAEWENTWHFVVATYNGSTKSIYKDGVLIGNVSASGTIGITGTAIAYLGSASGTSEFFNGTIDDFAVYNVSLTPNQILALYNNRTDLIDTSMLQVGDTWNVSLSPNDGGRYGITRTSTNLTILVGSPTVTLLQPVNNSLSRRINETFFFNVTLATPTICSLFNNASGTFQNISSISSITLNGNNSINHTSIGNNKSIAWNVECRNDGIAPFASANFTLDVNRTPTLSFVTPTPANTSFVNGTRTINVSVDSNDTVASISIFIDNVNQTTCSSQTWCNLSWNTTAETAGVHWFHATARAAGVTGDITPRNVSTQRNYTVNTSVIGTVFINETTWTVAGATPGSGELERGSYNASLNFTNNALQNLSNVYYGFPKTSITATFSELFDQRAESRDIATFDDRKENVTVTTNTTHVIVNVSFENFTSGIHYVIFNFSRQAGGGSSGDSPVRGGGGGAAAAAARGRTDLRDIEYDSYSIEGKEFTIEELSLNDYTLITNGSHSMIIKGLKDVYAPTDDIDVDVYTYNLEFNASPTNVKSLFMELNRKEDEMTFQNFEFSNVEIGHYISKSKLKGHAIGNYTIHTSAEFANLVILSDDRDIQIIELSVKDQIVSFGESLDRRIVFVIILIVVLLLLISSIKKR